MKITRAGDYALRVMSFIASQETGKTFMRNELSETCKVPDSFLGKILQSLSKNNILHSERGKNGGFKLTKKPYEITIYDILKAVEGDILINECLGENDFCKNIDCCKTYNVLKKVKENFISDLKRYTLSDISDS